MCNKMVTREIRELFHPHFVQILIISRAFSRGKLLGFGQNSSKIIPQFHKYTFWLPINIMGGKLRSQL